MNDEVKSTELQKLATLLEQTMNIFEEDRVRAIDNYTELQAQLNEVVADSDHGYSQDAKLEMAVNKALEISIHCSDKILKVADTLSKIIITNLNNENRLQVANKFVGANGEKLINEPVNIANIQKRLKDAD
jgi:hypothetical protein